MKTLIFIDHGTVLGGAQLVLVNYLKYFDKKKFRCVVICSGDNPNVISRFEQFADKVYSVPFERLKINSPLALFRFVKSVIAVINIIYLEGGDTLLLNTERAVYVGTVAGIITGTKIVWFIRDFCYNRFLLNLLSRFSSKIYFVSSAIKKFYSGNVLQKGEVLFVSSDMNKKVEGVSKKDVNQFKKSLGITNEFVAGYIGRLAEWKGYKVLETAALEHFQGSLVCLIVGDAPSKKVLYSKNRKVRVIYTGFIDRVELVLSVLDTFVHPAVEPEPYATGLVEAMQARVPVIATNLGGTPEIIQNMKTGILVEPNDPKIISEKIKLLSGDKELCDSISRLAYAQVTKHNMIGDEVKRIESLL